MTTIDRKQSRMKTTLRSIDRGMNRMTLQTSGRIRAMRTRMEAESPANRRYDATAREMQEALTILATRISRPSRPNN
ncbi:hypothetical protein [Rhodococcus ruber]|uniref:hypothetical protein n=1 Tax=Rhodococcus ruber TaxID=1830 RepID=UPI00315D74B1